MAIPIGGLVSGLTRALTSYQGGRFQGQQQARQEALAEQERQRRARQDLLAQQLIGAQLSNYQSLAAGRQQQQAAAEAQQRAIRDAAARIRQVEGLDQTLLALPDEQLVEAVKTRSTQAPHNIDPLSDEGIRRQKRLVDIGVRQNPNVVIRQPQVTEREKASAAVAAEAANTIINRLEDADPGIGARVARKAAVRRSIVAALGRRIAGLSDEQAQMQIESTIEQSMTPEELEYYAASKDYLGSVLPGLSGKAVTAREWVIQAPRFFSLGATTPGVASNRRKARQQRIDSFYAEAGQAAPPRPPPVAPTGPVAPQPQTVGGRTIGRTADPAAFFRP